MKENILILGASSDPSRYSYQCLQMLLERNYPVTLIHPKEKEILKQKVNPDLSSVKHPIHTITLYVNPQISSQLQGEILRIHPKRVIMNPGSENDQLEAQLIQHKIEVVRGCSLVMMKTNQF